jgi:hypothetical protein
MWEWLTDGDVNLRFAQVSAPQLVLWLSLAWSEKGCFARADLVVRLCGKSQAFRCLLWCRSLLSSMKGAL